jgi:SOS response associated peptidase (SRAP)
MAERKPCSGCGRERRMTSISVSASGYYEWHDTPSGKQPYYFTAADGSPLSIAGLGDEWHDKERDEALKSCTMIICDANDFVGQVHDRMPVLLEPRQSDGWLTAQAGVEVLKPAPNDFLQRLSEKAALMFPQVCGMVRLIFAAGVGLTRLSFECATSVVRANFIGGSKWNHFGCSPHDMRYEAALSIGGMRPWTIIMECTLAPCIHWRSSRVCRVRVCLDTLRQSYRRP